MEQNGYVKLHRTLLDNPISQKPQYAWLWTTLLLLANHKPNKFMWNGEIIIIKEGQLITGRKQLSEKTGIPESTIEDILKYLETQHQIQQQKTTKFRLITIINWAKYQISNGKSNNKATTKQQQADTNKNEKNEKKNILSANADEEFNFSNYLVRMKTDKRKHIQIIWLFFLVKKRNYTNLKQVNEAIKRNVKIATSLVGYSGKQIKETMEWLDTKFNDGEKRWTLETVGKYIDDLKIQTKSPKTERIYI